jgi:hypothetical protein
LNPEAQPHLAMRAAGESERAPEARRDS